MTQNTQTTAERLFVLMGEPRLWDTTHDEAERRAVAKFIAAEIDALTAERDEARAEVERLRPAADAWRTLELYREAERNGTSEEAEAARLVHIPIRDAARARARAAKVTP